MTSRARGSLRHQGRLKGQSAEKEDKDAHLGHREGGGRGALHLEVGEGEGDVRVGGDVSGEILILGCAL